MASAVADVRVGTFVVAAALLALLGACGDGTRSRPPADAFSAFQPDGPAIDHAR